MEAVMNQQRKKIHPHKFTLWVAIASILMMFAGLTSAFIVKSNLVGWRDIQMPNIFWGIYSGYRGEQSDDTNGVAGFPATGNEELQVADRDHCLYWESFLWCCNG